MVCDKVVEEVKILAGLAVKFHHLAVFDFYPGCRVIGAIKSYQTHIDPFFEKAVLVHSTLLKYFKAFLSLSHFLSTSY